MGMYSIILCLSTLMLQQTYALATLCFSNSMLQQPNALAAQYFSNPILLQYYALATQCFSNAMLQQPNASATQFFLIDMAIVAPPKWFKIEQQTGLLLQLCIFFHTAMTIFFKVIFLYVCSVCSICKYVPMYLKVWTGNLFYAQKKNSFMQDLFSICLQTWKKPIFHTFFCGKRTIE